MPFRIEGCCKNCSLNNVIFSNVDGLPGNVLLDHCDRYEDVQALLNDIAVNRSAFIGVCRSAYNGSYCTKGREVNLSVRRIR